MTFIDIITHLFLPHDSNNQRPRILHTNAYLLYIVLFLFFGVGVRIVHHYAPNILGIATNISVTDLLNLTNQKRAEAGLPPLNLSSQLSAAAAGKAADMIGNNYWAHFSPSGKSPWDFIVGSGYRYIYAGENLAKDFNDSAGVVNAWMESPTHRSNIVKSEYKEIGFAVVNGRLNGEETTLVVQMFGTANRVNAIADNSNSNNQEPAGQAETLAPVVTTAPVLPEATITQVIYPVGEAQNSDLSIETGKPVYIAGIKTTPLINITDINKSLTLLLLGLLLTVLTLDGFLIWQKKTVRISGHNFAHIIFIGAMIMAVWLTTSGSVL